MSHREYMCGICGMWLLGKRSLKDHLRDKHGWVSRNKPREEKTFITKTTQELNDYEVTHDSKYDLNNEWVCIEDLNMHLDLLSEELGNECDEEIKTVFPLWEKGARQLM